MPIFVLARAMPPLAVSSFDRQRHSCAEGAIRRRASGHPPHQFNAPSKYQQRLARGMARKGFSIECHYFDNAKSIFRHLSYRFDYDDYFFVFPNGCEKNSSLA
jgi:hypothetical protein